MKTVVTKDENGKEITIEVRKPSGRVITDGQILHAGEWQKAINYKPPAILRDRLESVMREQGLWDDAKEAERDALRKSILENERKLKAGGISLKHGKAIALQMSKDREAMRKLVEPINRLDGKTAEALADNAQFNFFVANCCRKAVGGQLYFKDVEDYLDKIDTEVARDCALTLMKILYPNYDENADEKLPEIQFLKKWNFIDSEGILLNDKKQRVDEDGRLINEKMQYIDEDGNLVDDQGFRVDEKGEYIVDEQPFLDDDGKPISETKEEPFIDAHGIKPVEAIEELEVSSEAKI